MAQSPSRDSRNSCTRNNRRASLCGSKLAARCKAWNVFARSNTGIVGSNPARGMDVCFHSVFVLSCVGSGLATEWSLVQGVLLFVYKCKITEPHKEEAKARYGLERHIRRRRRSKTKVRWRSNYILINRLFIAKLHWRIKCLCRNWTFSPEDWKKSLTCGVNPLEYGSRLEEKWRG
jgi:hypothetical protein